MVKNKAASMQILIRWTLLFALIPANLSASAQFRCVNGAAYFLGPGVKGDCKVNQPDNPQDISIGRIFAREFALPLSSFSLGSFTRLPLLNRKFVEDFVHTEGSEAWWLQDSQFGPDGAVVIEDQCSPHGERTFFQTNENRVRKEHIGPLFFQKGFPLACEHLVYTKSNRTTPTPGRFFDNIAETKQCSGSECAPCFFVDVPGFPHPSCSESPDPGRREKKFVGECGNLTMVIPIALIPAHAEDVGAAVRSNAGLLLRVLENDNRPLENSFGSCNRQGGQNYDSNENPLHFSNLRSTSHLIDLTLVTL